MIKTLINAWKIIDLRKRILYTVMIIIVFRIGSMIPVPFLNVEALRGLMGNSAEGGALLAYLDTLSGGAFAQATLFAMSITPYVNSSIIMQLMGIALPVLENLQKEGSEGQKKINTITRYVTIALGLMQGAGYYLQLKNSSFEGQSVIKYTQGASGTFVFIIIVLIFTAGTALIMWLGERINEKGIGNGVSILLFAGIVSRLPAIFTKLSTFIMFAAMNPGENWRYFVYVPIFLIILLGMMWIIVFINDAERRIPVQYAQRTAGRRLYAGQISHIPLKVGLAGIMPVIFASSILSMPTLISLFTKPTGFFKKVLEALSINGWLYAVIYFFLIIMFSYFYVSISFEPLEMANNLRQSNGVIPGIRPGKPTMEFFDKILSKITFLGAIFLAFIAIFPIVFGFLTGMSSLSLSGTSIVILVGVALETIKQLESQMMMRKYKGFLD
ncbi:MAG: preprotein translocase subunit SecY [Candidatus Paraimprobicoccus trichonymphae]|uniref:Protein translocase subunit SecY n=1 Tax=Candidatus Paraimprobicoccus trichonymphae TaxID=3033793 RepID=A0AA48KZZ4_9FIRM|nr:MAG: preprotein translocase subunit SecY [Candidatus Paraimprobicoccus trichonymphae]